MPFDSGVGFLTFRGARSNMRDGEMGSATWFRRRSNRVLVLVCLASASCSVLIDKDRVQCTTDMDCRARGPEFAGAVCSDSTCHPDPIWGCLGSVIFPKPAPGTYTINIHVRDLVNGGPIAGVTGRLCERPDTTCAAPLSGDMPSNQAGDVVLMVRSGFDGYVELKAPGRMPGLYFIYPPMDADREVPLVPLIEETLVEQLALLNMKTLVPGRGHVLLGTYDCRHIPAEAITLSSPDADEQTANFYVLNNLPKIGAPATDASGRGGFINMKGGIVAITANVAADNRKIATLSLLVRPGMMTFTSIVPSPTK
jgi:hypothetical protein